MNGGSTRQYKNSCVAQMILLCNFEIKQLSALRFINSCLMKIHGKSSDEQKVELRKISTGGEGDKGGGKAWKAKFHLSLFVVAQDSRMLYCSFLSLKRIITFFLQISKCVLEKKRYCILFSSYNDGVDAPIQLYPTKTLLESHS
jgi:hypothetical protein